MNKEIKHKILGLIQEGYTESEIKKELKISKWAYYTYTTPKERKTARQVHLDRMPLKLQAIINLFES